MNYSIITTKDIHNDQQLEFNKNGNKYSICLSNEKENIIRNFEDYENAIEMYNFITTLFIKGWYSFDERKDILFDNYPLPF